jgi:hypothetical protein
MRAAATAILASRAGPVWVPLSFGLIRFPDPLAGGCRISPLDCCHRLPPQAPLRGD